MSWNFNWGELQMGLLSPSLVLNVFELEWTFDELIFPCLVGLSDDRLDGVHNSDDDDDDGGGSKLFSKIEWMCVCVRVKWRAYMPKHGIYLNWWIEWIHLRGRMNKE